MKLRKSLLRTEQLDIIAGFLPRHGLYENVRQHMRRA